MNKQQRLTLIISILASFIAFLDGSVINVALPAMVRNLGGGLVLQQWVVDAYLLTLGSLILIAGSLSDLFGRKKILMVGLLGFGAASLLCAAAPNGPVLISARAFQGMAGALLVPSSLALIISAFKGQLQGKAIGTWTAWTGIAFIIGPLLGGILIDKASWRLIFAINLIPIAITLFLMRSLVEAESISKRARVDIVGACLCVLGLGGSVFALIEESHYGWKSPIIFLPLLMGIIILAFFVWYEKYATHPMLPMELFKVRNFSIGNIATTTIYAGLSVATFLLVIFLQQVGQYSALQAGFALLPVTIIMFFLSPRFGALSGKYGPRLFMGIGPIVAGTGFLLLLFMNQKFDYVTHILPGVIIFGLGLSMTVAPLTAAILGDIESSKSGIASAINNAVARIAGLVAIATIGLVVGKHLDFAGFHRGIIVMASLLILGGIVSMVGIHNPVKQKLSKNNLS